MTDWTTDETGRANASVEFDRLTVEVARLIRASSHDLILGRTDTVARLILAQLTHVHGFAPLKNAEQAQP